MVAFISDVAGIPQVWVKNLAEGGPLQITFGETRAQRPRWSPKGDQILFTHGVGWNQSIWSVPPLGGPPRRIVERGRNPAWMHDGSRLVYEVDDQVWTSRADGSDARRLEGIPNADLLLADRTPSYSPDGSQIAFFQCEKGPIGDVWVVPSDGGEARRVTFDNHLGGTPVWTPDGEHIIFSSMRAGSRTLWRVPAAGGAPEPVTQGAGEDTEPDVSADGRLIYTNTRNSFVLTVWNPSSGGVRSLWEARYDITDPSFSPRGDRITFFVIVERGDVQIFTIGPDGSNLMPVTRGKGERNVHPRWSPDGSALYYYRSHPAASLRKILLSGGPSSEIAAGWTWGSHNGADIDPSETMVACSLVEKGRAVGTVIRSIQTAGEKLLPYPLRHVQWSRDGKSLLATDTSGNPRSSMGDIVVCSVDPFNCRKITRGYNVRWSRDESDIYFLRVGSSRDGRELWSCATDGSGERRLGELRPMHPISTFYDVSPDGEVVFVRFNQGRNELWLAEVDGS
jgi:Tol biopolymer transport system component